MTPHPLPHHRKRRRPASTPPRAPRTGTRVLLVVLGLALLGVTAHTVATGTWSTSPRAVPTASSGTTDGPPPEDGGTTPTDPGSSTDGSAPTEPTSPAPPPASTTATFTILAAGDVLPHTTVLRTAESADGWDFSPLWSALTPWVQAADLALCHLEVPITPDGVAPTGYPLFGSPPALATDLARAGWDGCSTASNHSLDLGRAGLDATLDALDASGLGHAGGARTSAEAERPQLYHLERAGQTVTVAHLSATYGTNGLPVPADAPWAVELLDTDRIVAQAAAARAAGADLVLASVHCCEEYTDAPVERQVEIARALADSGQVDLVIGNHSHVPQPMELLEGGPGGTGMWVAYSMGNYISNQDAACCRPQTGTGTLMWAGVEKPPGGPARITGLEWTAVPGDRVGSQRIYAMPDLLEGRVEAPLLTLTREELELRQQRVVDVIGTQAPERTLPPVPTGPPPVVVPRADGAG